MRLISNQKIQQNNIAEIKAILASIVFVYLIYR